MSDLVLICENCKNPFVFSQDEQVFYSSKGLPAPKLCPICKGLLSAAKKIPPKPKK